MDILYLLIPLSVVLGFLILAALYWAVESGQFDEIDAQGEQIFHDD
ncbi:MAG: cbb3-type cytochrome oxidase assembly protein CcoS [Rhodoferax sp.]|jgi:cbb3-type cytochrome oxidase maturation protein